MPRLASVFVLALLASGAPGLASGARAQTPLDIEPYRAAAARIIDAALADSAAYDRATYLGDTFGHRLSGSDALENAIDWILGEMRADGLESVRGQPAYVPVWIRGDESAMMTYPRVAPLEMLGLGGSIGTSAAGVEAEVMVVGSFEELEARAPEAEGKIVLFNVPFTSYGETVQYRTLGAIHAARAGRRGEPDPLRRARSRSRRLTRARCATTTRCRASRTPR